MLTPSNILASCFQNERNLTKSHEKVPETFDGGGGEGGSGKGGGGGGGHKYARNFEETPREGSADNFQRSSLRRVSLREVIFTRGREYRCRLN